MVSLRQEQNPIMKFAVPFLKMFALCMLWRAQFLSDFYSVFCVQKVSQKVRIFFLLLAIIQDKKTPNISNSKLYKVIKSAISPQRKLRSL